MTQPTKQMVRFADSRASVHFDALRGVAAFLVLLEHWRNLLFVDFTEIVTHRVWFVVLYGLSGAGHQSVVSFFVLSGFFIGGTVFRSVERNQWQWSGYLLRRLVRLWIVLLPTLLLCLAWDKLGISLGHSPALYTGHVNNHILANVTQQLSPRIFFGNLFFLQTVLTPVFGSDGALWSLAFEFWYYILFPLLFVALWRTTSFAKRILFAILFVAVAWFVRGPILQDFPMWLAGVVLFKVSPPRFPPRAQRPIQLAATMAYFSIFFGISRFHGISSLSSDYVLALVTLLYLWVLLSDREPHQPASPYVLASREAARFSFTLYAVHAPLLVLIASLVVADSRWAPTVTHLTAGFAILLGALGFAWALAFVTEFRTDMVRGKIEKMLGMKSAPTVLPSNPLAQAPNVHSVVDSVN